jgi:hypothetical protein
VNEARWLAVVSELQAFDRLLLRRALASASKRLRKRTAVHSVAQAGAALDLIDILIPNLFGSQATRRILPPPQPVTSFL